MNLSRHLPKVLNDIVWNYCCGHVNFWKTIFSSRCLVEIEERIRADDTCCSFYDRTLITNGDITITCNLECVSKNFDVPSSSIIAFELDNRPLKNMVYDALSDYFFEYDCKTTDECGTSNTRRFIHSPIINSRRAPDPINLHDIIYDYTGLFYAFFEIL